MLFLPTTWPLSNSNISKIWHVLLLGMKIWISCCKGYYKDPNVTVTQRRWKFIPFHIKARAIQDCYGSSKMLRTPLILLITFFNTWPLSLGLRWLLQLSALCLPLYQEKEKGEYRQGKACTFLLRSQSSGLRIASSHISLWKLAAVSCPGVWEV